MFFDLFVDVESFVADGGLHLVIFVQEDALGFFGETGIELAFGEGIGGCER